jgi:hypothetical protein
MPVTTVLGYDAMGVNAAKLPRGAQAAGYVTGTGGVPWSAQDWLDHPGAVRIDQSPVPSAMDATSDVQDMESGAVTLDELAARVRLMQASYAAGIRPGQRSPAVYASKSRITDVVNALIAGGIAGGVGLAVADYNTTQTDAAAAVAQASGPYPIIWYQFADLGDYDAGVFSVPWLDAVSVARPPAPPGQWSNPAAWTWRDAWIAGTGLDGNAHAFRLASGQWAKLF